jgi:uncharacterized protein
MTINSQFSVGAMKQFIKMSIAALVLASSAVFALELQDAKSQGLVGETETGYLAAVAASSAVNALVADINGQRKAEYERIAKQNGIALIDVEKLAAKKAIEKTPAGQYVKVGGSWQKK